MFIKYKSFYHEPAIIYEDFEWIRFRISFIDYIMSEKNLSKSKSALTIFDT